MRSNEDICDSVVTETVVISMPERFKVSRAEEPEREAVHGKLLPTYAEVEQKGTYYYLFQFIHFHVCGTIYVLCSWMPIPTHCLTFVVSQHRDPF